jgi:hypothetical protein
MHTLQSNVVPQLPGKVLNLQQNNNILPYIQAAYYNEGSTTLSMVSTAVPTQIIKSVYFTATLIRPTLSILMQAVDYIKSNIEHLLVLTLHMYDVYRSYLLFSMWNRLMIND